jgi:MFS transporter, PAT family, beta-lactamase induction signal transducer AmpG
MTDAAAAPAARPLVALSEQRNLRFFVLFLLYVAQGLPFGLFQAAVPAWLAQNGASAGEIGAVLAMVMLPWTLKLIYCFLVDRYAFLAMGRRRPWIIVSQFGIVAGLIAMAIVNPSADQASLVAAFAFAINIASSMQDVAVDGLAVDILPADEIARASGFFYGGQALGVSLAGGVGGYLIAFHSLTAALLALAAVTAVILVAIIIVRERPGERLLPWTKGIATQRNLDLHVGTFGPIIRAALTAICEPKTLLFVGALFFAGGTGGLIVGLGPIYSVEILGWQKNDYSSWASQSNLVAAILAILVFGLIVQRWGARRIYILAMVSVAAIALAMLMLQPIWANGLVLIGFIFVSRSLNTFRLVAGGAVSMALCTPAVAASQFTLLVAFINFGNMAAGASLGWIDSLGGIPAMFTALAVCGLLSAAFAFAAKVGR